MAKNSFFTKYRNWEYWPSYMFYLPNLPYAVYLMIRAKNFMFYSTVNPSIKSSGNGTESKYQTLQLIPDNYKPKSVFISKKRSFNTIIKELHQKGIEYPMIAKPDIGFRGMLVKKIYSDQELKVYLEQFPIDIIIQEFIDLPNECGIFYSRLPTEEKGNITSFTLKSFLNVKGNGFSTLRELVLYDKRAQHYEKQLEKKFKKRWETVPVNGEVILLSEIGNHNKGTQFINGNHLIDNDLIASFDRINKQINGWYYGRLDIKYNSLDELRQGKNLIILEINGTISEPTHLYDPYQTSFIDALKSIRKHWKILYHIATTNIKNGIKPECFLVFWKDVKNLMSYIKKVEKLSKKNS